MIWCQQAPSPSGAVPIELLFPEGGSPPDYRFYLQTDDYAGYHALAEKDGILGHMGCRAHLRRKAVEAANSRTKTGSDAGTVVCGERKHRIVVQPRGVALVTPAATAGYE